MERNYMNCGNTNEMTACDHRSESQFKQLQKSPKKVFSGLQQDSKPWPLCSRRSVQRPRVRIPLKPQKTVLGLFHNCLNCDSLQRSYTVISTLVMLTAQTG